MFAMTIVAVAFVEKKVRERMARSIRTRASALK
jgi:hypothetical protein